jgi:GNAT superfamily N-acetyltransferase
VGVKVALVTTITDVLRRLEACYDALPRAAGARVERIGPFVLFLREGEGFHFYARPAAGATEFTPSDVDAVRTRQREAGVPQAFEWVHEVTPSLLDAVVAAGLPVLQAPLMVLDPVRLPSVAALADAEVRLLDPDAPEFAREYAISGALARLSFAGPTPGPTGPGGPDGPDSSDGAATAAGPAERDGAARTPDPAAVDRATQGIRSGRTAEAVAVSDVGMVARGGLQRAGGGAEIVGVATLAAARRRGYGAAVSAALARRALDLGDELVFLSAASEAVARVYARIGFHRVGTACIAGGP